MWWLQIKLACPHTLSNGKRFANTLVLKQQLTCMFALNYEALALCLSYFSTTIYKCSLLVHVHIKQYNYD